jgi:hypothetical protein
MRHPPGMDTGRDEALAALGSDPDGSVLRFVPLGRGLAPLRLDPGGSLVYVELSSGEQVGLSDANDEVGLLVQLHPAGDDAPIPTRYVRQDGVEVVEVPTRDGLLLVPSDLVPYDPCGGRTVGPSRNGP